MGRETDTPNSIPCSSWKSQGEYLQCLEKTRESGNNYGRLPAEEKQAVTRKNAVVSRQNGYTKTNGTAADGRAC